MHSAPIGDEPAWLLCDTSGAVLGTWAFAPGDAFDAYVAAFSLGDRLRVVAQLTRDTALRLVGRGLVAVPAGAFLMRKAVFHVPAPVMLTTSCCAVRVVERGEKRLEVTYRAPSPLYPLREASDVVGGDEPTARDGGELVTFAHLAGPFAALADARPFAVAS